MTKRQHERMVLRGTHIVLIAFGFLGYIYILYTPVVFGLNHAYETSRPFHVQVSIDSFCFLLYESRILIVQ